MLLRSIAIILGVIVIASCVSSNNSSPYTETGAVCDQAGLESQLRDLRDTSNSLKGSLGIVSDKMGAGGTYEQTNTDVDRRYELRDKMMAFDAEVDGQFRNVTSSCKAFSRCMEMNSYKEDKCSATMRRWDDAERAFSGLSVDLRELEVEVVRIQNSRPVIILPAPVKDKCKDECCDDPCKSPVSPAPKDGCCDTLGNIFTDCCG